MRWLLIPVALAGCGRLGFRDQPVDAAIDAVIDMPPDADLPPQPCAPSYTETVTGFVSKYRKVSSPDTWLGAERACEADGRGMHLVVISPTERNGVEDIAMGAMFWVGVTDRVADGTFLTVTGGTPTDTPWKDGMPTLTGPGCVFLDPATRTIQDVSCSVPLAYICECDEVLAQPSSY